MAEAGTLAYPVVTMMMYGVARVGRKERWGALEWLRLGALAALFGTVVAVQVALLTSGATSHPVAIAAGLASIAGMSALVGLYLWERWISARARPLPKLSATLEA